MANELKDFLDELFQLTQKYGFAIGGCGCCGSPYVYDITTGDGLLDDLTYNEQQQRYEQTEV